MTVLSQILKNKVFWVTLYSWVIVQTIKVIVGIIKERRFNFRWFVGTGGMPSSHAAFVSALSTCIGLSSGFDSALFVVTLAFSIIVIFDAQGVRRASGKQAEVLNKILDDIYWRKRIKVEERLKELLGHAPVEVWAGVVLGVVLSVLLW